MVEMNVFSMKFGKANEAEGSFVIDYSNSVAIPVIFTLEKDKVYFLIDTLAQIPNKLYDIWLETEGEEYKEFIKDYAKKVDEINQRTHFEGEIKGEFTYKGIIEIYCKYSSFPYDVTFSYAEQHNATIIEFDVPIPINSIGTVSRVAIVPPKEEILKNETLKRMWDPFRDKTQNRLKLLHLFR